MTTLTAVKKDKQICLASDGLTIFGSRKEISGEHISEGGKILEIGSNYIGIAGHPSWSLILDNYFAKRKKTPQWKTADEVFETFHSMHEDLKQEYFLNSPYLSFLPFESSEFELLIVNPYGIFEVEYSRVVRQYFQYSAIGTGEEYALGAISSVYNSLDDVKQIAKIGIESAAQFDRKTSLPIHIYSMKCL